jgi:ferredoxin-NADP reductase
VVRRIEETTDVISLVLEPDDEGGLPEIEPGQYGSVFVDLPDGSRQPRQYTVSATGVGHRMQITVRRVRGIDGPPDGRVSSVLHDRVDVGDVLQVSAPTGDIRHRVARRHSGVHLRTASFTRHARSTLLARGVPASRICCEVFGPDLWAAQMPTEPGSA